MQIIIGRDAKTSQLNVIIGQQTLRLGAPGSVPQTVSRQHCRITVTEGGTYLVENLKAANITYINNVGVEKKSMRREDSLALGTDRYQVDTKAVFAAVSPVSRTVATSMNSVARKRSSPDRISSLAYRARGVIRGVS